MKDYIPFILFILGVTFYNWQTRQTEIIKFKINLMIEVFNLVGTLRDMCLTISYPLSIGPNPAESIIGQLPQVQNALQAKVNQMILIDKRIFDEVETVLKESRKLISYFQLHKGTLERTAVSEADIAMRNNYYNKWTEECPAAINKSHTYIVELVGDYLTETSFSDLVKTVRAKCNKLLSNATN